MLRNFDKIYNKKCDNVAINVVDSNTYPYWSIVFIYAIYIYANEND
jgi:hypothetical protein